MTLLLASQSDHVSEPCQAQHRTSTSAGARAYIAFMDSAVMRLRTSHRSL